MNGFQKWLARTLLGVDTRSISYAQSLPYWMHNQPYRPDWDIEKATDEGYKASSIVYQCVKKKADAVASVPFRLYRYQSDGTMLEVEKGDLPRLLAQPNEFQTQAKLFWRWVAHLSLGGNTIVTKVRVGRKPQQLWAQLPKQIYPVTHNDKYILHYRLERGGKYYELPVEDVIHDQLPDPANPFWGIGELQALAGSVDSDVYAQQHMASSMMNRGMPSGVLMIKGKATPDQYQRATNFVKAEISGAKNNGKTLVIDQELVYQQLTQSFKELEFIEARRLTREEIAMGFGIDPIVLGFNTSATYANKQWARLMFWVDVIMPLAKDIASELTSGLVGEFYKGSAKDGFVIAPDFSKVEALGQMYKERAQTAKLLIDAGYDPEDVAEKLDLNLKVAVVVNAPVPPQPTETTEPSEDTESTEDTENTPPDRTARLHARSYPNRVDYWVRADAKRQRFERELAASIADIFSLFGVQVAEAYREHGSSAVFNAMAQEREYWRIILSTAYQAGAESFGEDVYRDLFDRGAPNLWKRKAQLIAEGLSPERVDLINDASVTAVRELLEQATQVGLEQATIAQGLEQLYDRWRDARSMTVAVSEVGLIMNHSQYVMGEVIEQQGDPLVKEWISRQDGNVRPTHIDVDGQVRKLKETFSNGLLYPGDPRGDPSETINCRCVLGYQLEEAI